MKAFNFNVNFSNEEYPDDCYWLHDYLKDAGTLNITPESIPEYYKEFSKEFWHTDWHECWGNDDIKFEFAQWLSEKDLY